MTILEHLRSLEAAATPGPWGITCDSDWACIETAARLVIPSMPVGEDADLIVAMRNALPVLLAVAEAAAAFKALDSEDRDMGQDAVFAALAALTPPPSGTETA